MKKPLLKTFGAIIITEFSMVEKFRQLGILNLLFKLRIRKMRNIFLVFQIVPDFR